MTIRQAFDLWHMESDLATVARLGARRGSERDAFDTNSSENLSAVAEITFLAHCLRERERDTLTAIDQQMIADDMHLEAEVEQLLQIEQATEDMQIPPLQYSDNDSFSIVNETDW